MTLSMAQTAYTVGGRDNGSYGFNSYAIDLTTFDPQIAYRLGRIAGMRIGIGKFLGKCRPLSVSDRVFASMLVVGNTDLLPDEELLQKAHEALILKNIIKRLTS